MHPSGTMQFKWEICCLIKQCNPLQKGTSHLYGNLWREWPIDSVEEDIIQCHSGLLQFHLSGDLNLTF